MGKRITMHNGRRDRKGRAYSAYHNDRNFDTNSAKHIDESRTDNNRYWNCYDSQLQFEDVEKRFYETMFRASLDAQNERYIKNRHLERCLTMDEFRKGRGCPEETILQIGKAGESVPPDILWEIAKRQAKWIHETFPNVHILDMALHADEEGAPHVQMRQCWCAKDKYGYLTVSQNKALTEMGIQRPNPKKKENKWNNAKMTFTVKCRDHLVSLCRDYGIKMDLHPKDDSDVGLSLNEYKSRQEKKKAEAAHQELEKTTERIKEKERYLNELLEEEKIIIDEIDKLAEGKSKSLWESAPVWQRKEFEYAAEQSRSDCELVNQIIPDLVAQMGVIKAKEMLGECLKDFGIHNTTRHIKDCCKEYVKQQNKGVRLKIPNTNAPRQLWYTKPANTNFLERLTGTNLQYVAGFINFSQKPDWDLLSDEEKMALLRKLALEDNY